MRLALAILAVVAATHYGYFLWPEQDWAKVGYILRGAEGVFLYIILGISWYSFVPEPAKTLLVCAIVSGTFENAEISVCRIATWHEAPHQGMCRDAFGIWPYVGIAGFAVIRLLRKRREQ